MAGKGREAFSEVREGSVGTDEVGSLPRRDQQAFLEGRARLVGPPEGPEGSGGPPRVLGGVGRPSWWDRRGAEGWEGWEPLQECWQGSGGPPAGPGSVGRPSRRVMMGWEAHFDACGCFKRAGRS